MAKETYIFRSSELAKLAEESKVIPAGYYSSESKWDGEEWYNAYYFEGKDHSDTYPPFTYFHEEAPIEGEYYFSGDALVINE